METSITEQIKTVNPSVPPALFRLLMRDEQLAYLRDDKDNRFIYGFEITDDSPLIEGFALIGMRKRTISAYRSEDDKPRLIVFPTIDKLFNQSYGLLHLYAKKVVISDDSFKGKVVDEGYIGDLVGDLTPPQKNVDLPDQISEQMIRIMLSEYSDQEEAESQPAHIQMERFTPVNTPGYIPPIPEDLPDVPPIIPDAPMFAESDTLNESPDKVVDNQSFTSEHEIIDLVVLKYGVNRAIMTTLLSALLAKTQGMSSDKRLWEYKQLVMKLLREKPEVITKYD